VITSATNLLKEIFTVKGSGTFIKSYIIKDSCSLSDIDVPKLRSLLEDAFDKKLVENYFQSDIMEILYESDYEGVAIIKSIDGIPYLDKFAVAKHRQETGLGSSIWHKLTKKYPKLVLRVTPKNPMNAFYAKQCSGCIKHHNWNVYWINLEKDEILKTVDKVVQLEKTIN
jgi:acetylglutamate kinase